MPATRGHVSLSGTWYRHVGAGREPLGFAPQGAGRWQRAGVIGAVYLADTIDTSWAEFYRAAAEARRRPQDFLPRDLWRLYVELQRVVDLTSPTALARLGLARTAPTSAQWPPYQQVGERLAADGVPAVLYRSAARTRHRCLCVFAPSLAGITPLDHERISEPPIPPRGLRT